MATLHPNSLKNLTYKFPKGFTPWNKAPITKVCEECSTQYSVPLCRKESKYCSMKCLGAANGRRAIGKKYMLGTKQTAETIEKRASKMRGASNPKWIADRTQLVKKQERNDSAYQEWRKSVRDRDGWVCKMSNGDCLGKVVAHHILPWRDFVELRYEINNGITLCRFHHPRKRADEMKLSPYFQSLVTSNRN